MSLKTCAPSSAYASPWTLRQRVAMLAWEACWTFFCAWTPKPLNRWRLLWLKIFGATVEGLPFVHQRARIQIPWNVTLRHRSSVGDRTHLYSLGPIVLEERCVVAQEAYLCAGTHDLADPNLALRVAPIVIGEGAFIGARAFILPGRTVGSRAIVGACSVVTRDVPEGAVVAGNPAAPLSARGRESEVTNFA